MTVLGGRPELVRQRSIGGASAALSPCGLYRYELTRPLSPSVPLCPWLFIMLNPSTADALQDDPTIRRCKGFANRGGGTYLTVVNLFAFRSPRPEDLLTAADPVGPGNDVILQDMIDCHQKQGVIVVAWGRTSPKFRARVQQVAAFLPGIVSCLGVNKDGSPKHPLYVPNDQNLIPWEG